MLSQCFGTFKPNNLILNKMVCDDCNQYFGNNLELILGRDTIEGIVRYRHGKKPKKQYKHKRLKFRIREGESAGMIITPLSSSENNGGIDNDPVAQIAILNSLSGKYDYFDPDDMPHIEEIKKQGLETQNLRIKLIFKSEDEKEILKKCLREKGYQLNNHELPMDWPESVKNETNTQADVISTIDRIVARGFCKIAFNYLAHIQGQQFCLSPNFNRIRDFIRNDQGNSSEFFFIDQPQNLYINRQSNARGNDGHFIILEWNNMALQVRLRLFNVMTYIIQFCAHYQGLWVPINSGHYFNMKSRKISTLHPVRRELIP